MKYGLKTREKIVLFLSLLICPLFTCQIRALALEDDQVIKILSSNPGLFHENGIVASAFRFIGWGITKGIAALADVCAGLYDTCFGFIDFTEHKGKLTSHCCGGSAKPNISVGTLSG